MNFNDHVVASAPTKASQRGPTMAARPLVASRPLATRATMAPVPPVPAWVSQSKASSTGRVRMGARADWTRPSSMTTGPWVWTCQAMRAKAAASTNRMIIRGSCSWLGPHPGPLPEGRGGSESSGAGTMMVTAPGMMPNRAGVTVVISPSALMGMACRVTTSMTGLRSVRT